MKKLSPDVVGGVNIELIEKLNVVPLGAFEFKLFNKAITGAIITHDNGETRIVSVDNLRQFLVVVFINAL